MFVEPGAVPGQFDAGRRTPFEDVRFCYLDPDAIDLCSRFSRSRLRQEVARHGGRHGLEEPPPAVAGYEADLVEGHFSPSLASDLETLPPTFLAVGSLDLFLEEDVDYAMRLSRSGVPVELHVYQGGVHGFDLFPGNTTDRFSSDLRTALTRFLTKESTT